MGCLSRRALLFLALLWPVLLLGCRPTTENEIMITTIEVITMKPDDRASVMIGRGRALIDVESPSGISGLSATPVGAWPAEVVVRLRLRGLEQLEIAYGDVTLTTGLSSTGGPGPALMLSVTAPDGTVQSASPSADMYYPRIVVMDEETEIAAPTFPLPEGTVIEVTLPAHFHQQAPPSFSMRWIDFYR